VAAGDFGTVTEGDHHAVASALHRLGARPGQDRHTAALEDLFQHLGGVGIGAGKHPVAAGDQRDLRSQAVVGGGELGAGHTGTHHDELFRQLVQVVDLRPVEDPLAVGPRGGQFARVRADGQQDGVRFNGFRALGRQDLDGLVVQELAGAGQDADVLVFQAGLDVAGLLACEAQQAVIYVLEIGAHHRHEVAPVDVELHAQVPRLTDARHQVRRRDQRLGRHDVGQHGGSAEAGALDDGDLGPQGGGNHGGFVPAGASAENCDSGCAEIRMHSHD
jgi:hypothetical protein